MAREQELSEFGVSLQGRAKRQQQEATEPRPMPKVRQAPPADEVPGDLAEAIAEAEEAWDQYVRFEGEHAQIFGADWAATAEHHDRRAAREAGPDASVDAMSSTLADWRARRPRLLGKLDALHDEVVRTQRRLKDALRRNAPAMAVETGQALGDAAEKYVEAQHRLDEARAEYARALRRRAYWGAWAAGESDPGEYRLTETLPKRFGGGHGPDAAARYRKVDVDGRAEDVIASFDRAFAAWFAADPYSGESTRTTSAETPDAD